MDDPSAERRRAVEAAILESRKYARVAPELVGRLAGAALAPWRKEKDAEHEVRSKLHQVGTAFFVGSPRYSSLLEELRRAKAEGPDDWAAALGRALGSHSSTKERLPFLEELYRSALANVPDPESVLDLGCGLNPLCLPWMGLPGSVRYRAYDIFGDMIEFLNGFFAIAGIDGAAEVRDLTGDVPSERFDVALALKLLPTLDQIDPGAGERLLDSLNARTIIVSFPTKSLGGKRKGMSFNYESRFTALAERRGWQFSRFELPNELVFVVTK